MLSQIKIIIIVFLQILSCCVSQTPWLFQPFSRGFLAIFQSSVPRPWHLSFCFGRALQDGSKAAWRGRGENVELAQKVFVDRVKENGKAILGQCGVDNSNNSNGLINY